MLLRPSTKVCFWRLSQLSVQLSAISVNITQFFDYRKTSIRSRVPDTRRVPVRLRASRPLVRIEAGSRIYAGSRLEAGSINSFQYGQTPNTLLTLITTYATSIDMELDMSVDSIDAEPDEDEENEPLIWQWWRRRWWREQSGQWWLD